MKLCLSESRATRKYQLTTWRQQAGQIDQLEMQQAKTSLEQARAAVPALEQALALFGDSTADPTNHALAMWTLARALQKQEQGKERDRVRSLAERAYAMFAAQGAVDAHNRDAVARFLDRLAPAVSAKQRQEWADIEALAKSQGATFQPTAES